MLDPGAPRGLRDAAIGVLPVTGAGLRVERDGRLLLDVEEVGFGAGELAAIVGPNGAGKSLMLRCLAGLVRADAGTVAWAGRPPQRAGYRRLGYLMQQPVLLRRSAAANIAHALRAAGMARRTARERAASALQAAGLDHLAATNARLLSGGERQRLALARALALEPDILFLDEPCASLDPASTLAIETMVRQAHDDGMAVVLVTHDLGQARRLSRRAVFLCGGRIVEDAPSSAFFEQAQTPQARAFLKGGLVL